jgi:hypothetical protein
MRLLSKQTLALATVGIATCAFEANASAFSFVNQHLRQTPFVQDFVQSGKRLFHKIFPTSKMVIKEPTICDSEVQQVTECLLPQFELPC